MTCTSTWAEVDLSAITGNVVALGATVGTPVMAVVKANGYGHGAAPVARAALRGGATWLGVARAEEAQSLRAAGLDAPILVLGWTPSGQIRPAIEAGVRLTVADPEHLEPIVAAATPARPALVHVKVNTGMNRLGVAPEIAESLLKSIAAQPNVVAEGIFTHYACADEPSTRSAHEQTEVFADLISDITAAGLRPSLVHAANSAAALEIPAARWDLVRWGIAMYGLSPGAQVQLPDAVRPALVWKALLSQVREIPAGAGVSYGHVFIADRTTRIGTVPVGYADGLRRTLGNRVLVGGVEVPVLGRVCMDQIVVALDDVPDARVGDEVVLIGAQGAVMRTADAVAHDWQTIGYEVVCGLGSRVVRRYVD